MSTNDSVVKRSIAHKRYHLDCRCNYCATVNNVYKHRSHWSKIARLMGPGWKVRDFVENRAAVFSDGVHEIAVVAEHEKMIENARKEERERMRGLLQFHYGIEVSDDWGEPEA